MCLLSNLSTTRKEQNKAIVTFTHLKPVVTFKIVVFLCFRVYSEKEEQKVCVSSSPLKLYPHKTNKRYFVLALDGDVYCIFVTFPCGILGQV